MARSRKQVASGSRLIPLILRRLQAEGANVESLAETFGFPRHAERREELSIVPDDFEELLAIASNVLGDPLVALHLPGELETPSYNVGELAAQSSPTLQAAFERVARYGSLFYAHLSFELKVRKRELALLHRLRSSARTSRYGAEFAIASTLFHARRVAGAPLLPTRVWFQHRAPPEVEAVREFFGTRDVSFDRSENGIAFAASDAVRPLAGRDARLLRTAEQLADRAIAEHPPATDFVAAVSAKIRDALPRGDAEAAAIARRLRVSMRTFQRRLEGCGTSFSDLRAQVCRQRAESLLRDAKIPLSEVAYQSGFSDLATFGRAFKRWKGVSPSVYRRSAWSAE